MALTLRPPPQVYCSPSSAQTNVIISDVVETVTSETGTWLKSRDETEILS